MTPLQMLSEEHQIILKIIALVRDKSSRTGEELDQKFWDKIIFFIQNYADKFHHAKEEKILFPEINRQDEDGKMHCNPISQMLYEHELGRGFVKGMREGLAKRDKERLVSNALNYSQLLEEHIFKENQILYPMAEEAIGKPDWEKIAEKFEKVNGKLRSTEQKCLTILNEVARK
ncbi:MAG TPA: hemerythrin domain-containing protein [Candidatus Nanoarchaeia archaeon]|nr:hemerythrin domain-containing protein [Candidatus Nanoarchaeia archaeon]